MSDHRSVAIAAAILAGLAILLGIGAYVYTALNMPAQGPQGPQGDTGAQGPQGAPGSSSVMVFKDLQAPHNAGESTTGGAAGCLVSGWWDMVHEYGELRVQAAITNTVFGTGKFAVFDLPTEVAAVARTGNNVLQVPNFAVRASFVQGINNTGIDTFPALIQSDNGASFAIFLTQGDTVQKATHVTGTIRLLPPLP